MDLQYVGRIDTAGVGSSTVVAESSVGFTPSSFGASLGLLLGDLIISCRASRNEMSTRTSTVLRANTGMPTSACAIVIRGSERWQLLQVRPKTLGTTEMTPRRVTATVDRLIDSDGGP